MTLVRVVSRDELAANLAWLMCQEPLVGQLFPYLLARVGHYYTPARVVSALLLSVEEMIRQEHLDHTRVFCALEPYLPLILRSLLPEGGQSTATRIYRLVMA